MAVRKLNAITPGQRFKVVNGFDDVTTSSPEKSLLSSLKNLEDVIVRGKYDC